MSRIRNHPTQWTGEKVKKLITLAKLGMNFSEIAEQLGTTRMAAYSKWYTLESPDSLVKKLENRNRQVIERTGRFWRMGAANPRENALQMRKDYLRMTAHLLDIHGNPNLPHRERLKEQIFARFNIDI